MMKNNVSISNAFKMYTSKGLLDSIFLYVGLISVCNVLGSWFLNICGIENTTFPIFAMVSSYGGVGFMIARLSSPFDNNAGSRFFRTVRDRFNIFRKYRIALLIEIISMLILNFIATCLIGKFLFPVYDTGVKSYMIMLSGLLFLKSIINFFMLIKKPTTRMVLSVITSFILLMPISIISGNTWKYTNEKIATICGLLGISAMIYLIISEILVQRAFKKKFNMK